MGKDAISQSNTKEKTPSGSGNSSSLILILAFISIVAIALIFFKDKIIKKKTDTKQEFPDKPEEPKSQIKTESEPEKLEGDEAKEVNDKFAKLE